MGTFNWSKYLDGMAKDYNNKMPAYAPQLKLFAHASNRKNFVSALAPRIQDLRKWYAAPTRAGGNHNTINL
jgi:hypothetical protein